MTEQRSEAWFEARKGVITGSRVGSILGVNPYQKREDVLREMVREHFGAEKEFKGNAATNHGERMEPIALAFYEAHAKVKVDQVGLVKHDKYDWLGASPDGLIGLDGGLEIKCPFWAKEPYSVHDKPSYYAQCQLIMEVCDIEWMDFLCYISNDIFLIERLERNRDWFDQSLPILQDFHQELVQTIADEKIAERFIKYKNTFVSNSSTQRLEQLLGLIKAAELEIAPLREEFDILKKQLGDEYGTFESGRIKVQKVEKKGSVDSKKLYKDIDLDGLLVTKGKTLDDYRKESVVQYNVVFVGD
jgi:putative phage-type endonuclease